MSPHYEGDLAKVLELQRTFLEDRLNDRATFEPAPLLVWKADDGVVKVVDPNEFPIVEVAFDGDTMRIHRAVGRTRTHVIFIPFPDDSREFLNWYVRLHPELRGTLARLGVTW